MASIVENIGDFNKQDRRWNGDKPLAALDPYIPTWLTTSPANQRPANFWKSFFFQALKGNCEKCCIFRLNWWGPTSNLKLPFLDFSHTNNHLYIIYQSIMEMLTYFHRMSLNKNCGCMINSVAYRYIKSMLIIERVIYIYIYISSSWHHIFVIPPVFIEIYRWAIIEDLSIRRRVHTFLISWGQKTCEKHCYVDLS